LWSAIRISIAWPIDVRLPRPPLLDLLALDEDDLLPRDPLDERLDWPRLDAPFPDDDPRPPEDPPRPDEDAPRLDDEPPRLEDDPPRLDDEAPRLDDEPPRLEERLVFFAALPRACEADDFLLLRPCEPLRPLVLVLLDLRVRVAFMALPFR
jgi:hypothetical protein